jgi:NAD(P)H dehydrogenase (quinone)
MKKVLIIMGHPNKDSFGNALADTYQLGAGKANAEIRRTNLADLDFDPILHKGYNEIQPLEPDLQKVQEDILWAEHLVFVYPIWWGNLPALVKGFVDRVFLPGFAFKYRENSPWWDQYLKGKSARLITTADAPNFYFNWIVGKPAHKAMKKATLEFCGIKPVKITSFGSVRFADEAKRKNWLEKVERLGESLS